VLACSLKGYEGLVQYCLRGIMVAVWFYFLGFMSLVLFPWFSFLGFRAYYIVGADEIRYFQYLERFSLQVLYN